MPTRAADPLPEVPGARIDRNLSVTARTTLVHYVSSNVVAADATHALVVVHGLQRDAWNAFADAQVAVNAAASAGLVDAAQVVIDAPVFFNGNDRGKFPVDGDGNPTSNQLVWQANDWSSGSENRFPTSDTDVSSFLALDALISQYTDKTRFPALENVIIAGHSAGGQTVQRYALVGTHSDDPAPGVSKFRYVVANPGSYAYLSEARPRPNASCTGFNDWKYGLDNYPNKYNKAAVTQDRDAIVERFLGLPISFLYGAEPDQAGVPLDDTCATATQGTTHKARTRHFFDVLRETFRPFDTQLYATGVPGVAHDAQGVFASPVGVQALFGTLGRLVLVDATDAGLYTNVTAQGYTITLRFAFDQPPVDGFQITFDVRGGQSVGAVRGAVVTSTRGEQVVLRGTMEDGAASDVKLSEVLAGRAGGLDDPPHFQTWVGEVEVDVTGGSADKANGFQIVTL